MTSPRFELKDDKLVLNGIDFVRFARNFSDQNGVSPDEARKILARALDAKSYHEMRDKATVANPKVGSTLDILERASLISVGPFSRQLPEALGSEWQTRAVELFDKAVEAQRTFAANEPGRAQFIAIVGAAESGKTSLARHLAYTRGGGVRDITLCPKVLPFDSRDEAVYVYDRKAELPPPSRFGDRPVHPEADFGPHADLSRTVNNIKHNARAMFPFHEWEFGGIGLQITDAIQKNPARLIVLTFASVEALRGWVKSLIRPGFGDVPGRYIHEAVQVVDLDAMTFETIFSPPVDLRQR